MELLWQDVRYTLRTYLQSPGFAAVAVLSLALGVGANATIFTLLNAVLLTPLPVDRPSQLVTVYTSDQAANTGFGSLLPVSYPNLKDFREKNSVFLDMAGYSFPQAVSVSAGGEPQPAFAEMVTGNYFEVLGVKPLRGRGFTAEEDGTPGAYAAVVLSYGFWQRRLGGDPSIVGKTISINGSAFTVLGITPEGFRGVNSLLSPDLWAPSSMSAVVLTTQFRGFMNERRALLFWVAARLKPGVAPAAADANMKAIAAALEQEYPAPNRGRGAAVKPLAEATIFPGIRGVFVLGGAVLMTIVGLVLLIACSNVANLLMARASARQQEMAVRVALGAGRRRIIRQLLTESLLLALAGGAAGLLIAALGRNAIWSLRPPFLAQNFVDLTIDRRVLVFTAVVSVVTGIVFGLIPALQTSRTDVVGALKEESRGGGQSRRRLLFSHALVVLQVALSAVALVAAGLFLRSLGRASEINPGFQIDGLSAVAVSPGQGGYDTPRTPQFYREVGERLAGVAGVRSVAWAGTAPLTGGLLRTVIREGDDPEAQASKNMAVATVTSPGYFQTLGIPLRRGRDFTPADRSGSIPVAIVNQTLADRLWPHRDAVGKRFRFYTDSFQHEVVGVATTVKYTTIGEDPQIAVYVPLEQNPSDTMVLLVKADGAGSAALGAAEQEIRAFDRRVPLTNPFTMREILKQSLWPTRMAALILGVMGALALLLASVGLYGVMAHAVARRTHEIGIRMALGANRGRVLSMILGQAMTLVGIGLLLGVAAALAVSRVVSRLLFGLSAMDPATFVGVGVVLTLVALVASYLPARRASRLDPLRALR
jgi:putative ABC transport system permease protein